MGGFDPAIAEFYAAWLAELGHEVHLIDPVPLHVEQATARDDRITAEVGDARHLTAADEHADVVLMLGPLYHLLDADDRHQALTEAHRVRPGHLMSDLLAAFDDPPRRDAILRAARLIETDESMTGASAHLLAVARKPA